MPSKPLLRKKSTNVFSSAPRSSSGSGVLGCLGSASGTNRLLTELYRIAHQLQRCPAACRLHFERHVVGQCLIVRDQIEKALRRCPLGGLRALLSMAQYILGRRGLMGHAAHGIDGFAKSTPELDHADLQFGLMSLSASSTGK
jgi:hypothetical protein